MGMDLDAVFSKTALDNIREMISKTPHGEREKIADDIIAFEKMLCEKYNFKSAFKENKSES